MKYAMKTSYGKFTPELFELIGGTDYEEPDYISLYDGIVEMNDGVLVPIVIFSDTEWALSIVAQKLSAAEEMELAAFLAEQGLICRLH